MGDMPSFMVLYMIVTVRNSAMIEMKIVKIIKVQLFNGRFYYQL